MTTARYGVYTLIGVTIILCVLGISECESNGKVDVRNGSGTYNNCVAVQVSKMYPSGFMCTERSRP